MLLLERPRGSSSDTDSIEESDSGSEAHVSSSEDEEEKPVKKNLQKLRQVSQCSTNSLEKAP